jgi:hypothetical protein
MSPAPLIPCFLISNNLNPTTSITSTSWMTAVRPALRAAGIVDSCFQEEVERPCISLTNCTQLLIAHIPRQIADNLARSTSPFPGTIQCGDEGAAPAVRVSAAPRADQVHQPRRCVGAYAGVRRVSFTKVAVACLEVFTPGSANQPLDDAPDRPETSPPTQAVRTKRALRSAPVVAVRGARMPAFAETGASIVL